MKCKNLLEVIQYMQFSKNFKIRRDRVADLDTSYFYYTTNNFYCKEIFRKYMFFTVEMQRNTRALFVFLTNARENIYFLKFCFHFHLRYRDFTQSTNCGPKNTNTLITAAISASRPAKFVVIKLHTNNAASTAASHFIFTGIKKNKSTR